MELNPRSTKNKNEYKQPISSKHSTNDFCDTASEYFFIKV